MLKKAIRTAQNFFPGLAEAKNHAYHFARQRLGQVHERDFAAIPLLPHDASALLLDIGTNRGQSILAIRHYRPDARIVSFEPNPIMFAWLPRHFGDADGVRLINRGLGPEHVERALFIPSYRGFVYDGIATFSRSSVTAYCGPQTLYVYDPARLTISETVCVIDTLDSFALAPGFIKIDVEGFEYNVLLGARATLERHEPVLMLERSYGDARVQPLLRELGYVEVVARRDATRFELGGSQGLNMVLMMDRRLHAS